MLFRRAQVRGLFAAVLVALPCLASSFTPGDPATTGVHPQEQGRHSVTRARRQRRGLVLWVRNVDLPEALIFYDVLHRKEGAEGGWRPLLKQCKECGTAVIAIGGDKNDEGKGAFGEDGPDPTTIANRKTSTALDADMITLFVQKSVRRLPHPKDLLDALGKTEIQPRPFGGSSGFGAAQRADPPRPPLPSRAVVIGPTEGHSLAARLAGMRAVSLDDAAPLADAVLTVDEIQGLWLDDLATPGSYWLNPPHPRDERGNRVDPERLVAGREDQDSDRSRGRRGLSLDGGSRSDDALREGASDEEDIRRILADLSPL